MTIPEIDEAIKILKFQRGYFCDFKECQEQQALLINTMGKVRRILKMFDYLSEIIIGLVTMALTIALFFGLFTMITSMESALDDKLWNDGHCDVCGGAWQYEQAVGHRSSTSYIYICNGCGKRIEINEVR